MGRAQSPREVILADVRKAIAAHASSPLQPLPVAARFGPRKAGTLDEEIERMLGEVKRVSGHGRKVHGREEFAAALGQIIRDEGIRTAAFSDHPLHRHYDTGALLKGFGIGIVSPDGDARGLADCDLGISVADAALPETGTVLLRTTQGQPDALSLLPRVHLALITPAAFQADLHHVFALAKEDSHFVLVTGCSRTADIEKVLTLGVHGPKSYHLWICD
ncbi:MAG: LUD domain-containing protein [Deltaproteobacteria bacterium]|nr:LUD domain-containing protein [Deltaproteobacteria bacterium]